jgi:hypothetical protein
MCSKQIAASWCLYKEVGREMKAAASNAPTQKSSGNKKKQRQATRVIKKVPEACNVNRRMQNPP